MAIVEQRRTREADGERVSGSRGGSVRGHRRREIACIASAPSNPYLRLLYKHLAPHLTLARKPRLSIRWLWRSRHDVGVVHVHWPEVLHRYERGPRALRGALSWLKLLLAAARLLAARLLGYRLVWTIHQVYPHESASPRRDRLTALLLGRLCHVLLAHDRATADEALRELGQVEERLHIVPHGSYVGVYPRGRERGEMRAALGLADDAFVFLAFGELRPYKGVEQLLDAFAAARLENAALVFAGNPKDPALAGAVRGAAASDPRIKPLLGLVPEEGVAELFEACDAAVLARSDGGTSGSLILALSLGLPVVAAETPAYLELTDGGRAGWLFRPGDPASMCAALEHAASDPEAARTRGRNGLELAHRLRWAEIGERTARLMLGA